MQIHGLLTRENPMKSADSQGIRANRVLIAAMTFTLF